MTRATDFDFLNRFGSMMKKRLGTMMLIAGGLAAAAAQADPGADVAAAATASAPDRACPASGENLILAQFKSGTTFRLTDTGLVVLKQPAPKKWYSVINNVEPEFPNTGN